MSEEPNTFRQALGIIAVMGGFACLAPLYFVPIPDGNKEALLLAVGVVLGWGGSVISGEWGSSPAGRAAASAGLKKQTGPSGTPSDPITVEPAP